MFTRPTSYSNITFYTHLYTLTQAHAHTHRNTHLHCFHVYFSSPHRLPTPRVNAKVLYSSGEDNDGRHGHMRLCGREMSLPSSFIRLKMSSSAFSRSPWGNALEGIRGGRLHSLCSHRRPAWLRRVQPQVLGVSVVTQEHPLGVPGSVSSTNRVLQP